MDMDQAAVFLAGSILTALGIVVLMAALVVINNLLHKYWKPGRILTSDSFNLNGPARFATDAEMGKLKSAQNTEPEFKEPTITWPKVPSQPVNK